jgi:hypothetical protein
VGAKRQAEHDRAEIVVLAGRAGEERALPRAPVPAAGEAEEAREVLLRDRALARSLRSPSSRQGRQDRVPEHRLRAERREQAVELGVRADVVEA